MTLKFKKKLFVLWIIIGGAALAAVIITLLSYAGILHVTVDFATGVFLSGLIFLSAVCQAYTYGKELKQVYKKASMAQLDEIYQVYSEVKKELLKNGIDQWDDAYPNREDIKADIEKEQLYTLEIGGKTAAVYVLNTEEDSAYRFASWKDDKGVPVVIHRFCVAPAFQNMGVAARTLLHMEKEAKEQKNTSVRLDVFTKNPAALALYEKAGYEAVGEAYWRKGKFLLMEKLL